MVMSSHNTSVKINSKISSMIRSSKCNHIIIIKLHMKLRISIMM